MYSPILNTGVGPAGGSSVADLLARFHAAARSFVPPSDVRWNGGFSTRWSVITTRSWAMTVVEEPTNLAISRGIGGRSFDGCNEAPATSS